MPAGRNDIDDRVIQGLYEAAAGAKPWQEAMHAFDATIAAWCSQLVVIDKHTGHLLASHQPEETPAEAVLDYIREYHRIDPHTRLLAGGAIGEVLHTADLFPAATYNTHPFYRDFWLPYNVRSFVGAKVGEDDRAVAIMAMIRSFDDPAYSKNEIALIGRYLSHLVVAMRIASFLRRVQSVAAAGYELMEGSSRPMILMDHNRSILAANQAARRFLSQGKVLFAENEILKCRSGQAEATLAETLRQLSRDAGGGDTVQRKALTLVGSGQNRVLCSLWNLTPESAMGAFGPYRSLLLTIAVRAAASEGDPLLLASMFDFTPAEARVAATLMSGQDLYSIAASLRVSVQTVRSHLKSIFLKTNTHRQAELITLLHEVASL